MRPGDAFDDEMRRHPRNPVPPLDHALAERLLDGTVHEDDLPPDYQDVLRVLSAAAAPAPPVPSAEAAALAAFRSARRPVDPRRRTSVLSKLLGAKAVAAIVLGTATVGTAAAAATGTLPDAAQAKAHSIVAAVPDADPAGHGAGAAKAADHTAQAGGASNHATLPGAAGLCQAYGSGSGGDNGRRLDSTAFGRLADAAGGTDKIDAYCTTVTAAASRAAGAAATGEREALAAACRAWLAADRAGREPAAAVLDRLTAAAGGAAAVGPYCTELVGSDPAGGSESRPSAAPSARPSAPPATPHGSAPTAPPANGGQGSNPSHPAPPTPRG
jgi:hypothetical protein